MSRRNKFSDGSQSPWHEIRAVVGDREISGYWSTSCRMVYVWSASGSAATQLGGMPSGTLAKILLREISRRGSD
jgi:hypothetical protein